MSIVQQHPARAMVEKMFHEEPLEPRSFSPDTTTPARDPSTVLVPAALPRNLLALDLATHCGWAIARRDGSILGGTESFAPRASWGPAQRALRYRAWLTNLIGVHQIHAITYEQVVRRPPNTQAATAHLYGLLEGLMWMAASVRQIEVVGVGISAVKRHWTGSGSADKDAMEAEAKRRGFRPDDHNHADALAILDMAIVRESGGAWALGGGGLVQVARVAEVARPPAASKPRKCASARQEALL